MRDWNTFFSAWMEAWRPELRPWKRSAEERGVGNVVMNTATTCFFYIDKISILSTENYKAVHKRTCGFEDVTLKLILHVSPIKHKEVNHKHAIIARVFAHRHKNS